MLPSRVLYHGKDEDLPPQVDLRAGPFTLVYEQGDLRYICLGSTEVIRRIYVAVRDRNWGTIAPVLSNVCMQLEPDSFQITYQVENRRNEIDFAWKGSITGTAEGTITFSMDGAARSTFWRNRIGFCVLHPANLAGHSARVVHVNGEAEPASFPVDFVSDQPVMPFAEMASIMHAVLPGIQAEVVFSGDVFEMEDQRNWTDASYKTFCTPLRLPYPVEIQAGTRVAQKVTLRLRAESNGVVESDWVKRSAGPAPTVLTIDSHSEPIPLPKIGLGAASHGHALSEPALSRLRAMNLHHLRVDLLLRDSSYQEKLRQAAGEAHTLGIKLAVAVLVSENAAVELEGFRREIEELRPPVCAWLCYPERELFGGGSPTASVLSAVRKALQGFDPTIPICAGTNTDFIFLKRSVPPADLIQQVTFAICPQVHAFDNASLVETLEVQGDAVRSARRLCPGVPVVVSPVTLKMRHNPYATGTISPVLPDELPPQVDVRQMSLFGAAWTLGSIKYLAEAGAEMVTYYETTGWRGVMETESGSTLPDVFRSLPGSVFPLYHVFANITGEFADGSITRVASSASLKVIGMLLHKDNRERLLLANLTATPQSVRIDNLTGTFSLHCLDEDSAVRAMQSPEEFCAEAGETITPGSNSLSIVLRPYALARIDKI
jgi:hypothetical protein